MAKTDLTTGALAINIVGDYGKLPGYMAVQSPRQRDGARRRSRGRGAVAAGRDYGDERGFWVDALAPDGLRVGEVITLHGFTLTPWVPRVPGLYWKDDARRLRAAARGEMIHPGLYTPVGKTRQVLGGVGTVRLLPTKNGRLTCATSSGNTWAGIPVLLTGEAWDAYNSSEFGKVYDITGKWELIPADYVDSLGGEQGIRRCCLMVEDKKSIRSADPHNYQVDGSAWTLFEYEDNDNITQYAFAYTTFYIAPGSAIGEVEGGKIEAGAVDWLQEYVQGYHGRPLTEFDQEEQHFDASLPLNDLMTRRDYRDQIVAFINRVKQRVFEPDTARYDRLPGVLVNLFDAEQLSILAFDHLGGLKLSTLVGPAAGLADQVEALILYCEQRDKLNDLILGVVHEKPNAAAMLDGA